MAFDILDRDGSGEVTVDELVDIYDTSVNPEVQKGDKTPEEAMREFMMQWERHEADGIVTFEEFEDYYKEISASIDDDDYFELMMRNAWRIAGGKGAAANTANKRVLVTGKDGRQRVETINKELGMKQGDKEDIRRRLEAQGIDAADIELHGGMDTTEKPKKRGGVPPARGSRVEKKAPLAERHFAAAKLAAAYRGKLARKKVDGERRKVAAQEAELEEQRRQDALPKAAPRVRPKGRSYCGF